MKYQQWLLKIRPEILIKNTQFSITEQFQNETLRPILKLLNNSIIEFSKMYISSLEISFENKSSQEIEKILTNLFNKHPTFKIYLVGMLLGYLTQKELRIYLENQKELQKRILILLKERLRTQFLF